MNRIKRAKLVANTVGQILADPGMYGRIKDVAEEHNCNPKALSEMVHKLLRDNVFLHDLSLHVGEDD